MQRPLVVPFFLLCTAIPVFSQSAPFGISAAVAADAVLVSRTDETSVGVVHVFQEHPTKGWQLAGELTASDGKVGDYFGYFVQAHGDRVFVGAPSAVAGQGAIYVFKHSPEAFGWAEVAKLTGEAEDQIGASMAISDKMIITGGLAGGAHVTVFTQTGESWQRTQTVTAKGLADNWGFGVGLAADAERLYVGAPLSNHGNGAVYVFSLEEFREETVLTSSDSAHVALGASLVSAGAGILLAGAPGVAPETQPPVPPPPGAVLEFKRSDNGAWTQGMVMFGNKDGNTDLYGSSMALDESRLLIGAAAAGWFKGRLYTFERDEIGGWTARDRLYKDGDMGFGLALDLAGDTLVVTAHPSSQGVGAAYVFRSADGAWQLAGKLLSGEEPPEPEGAGTGMVASDGPSECADGKAWLFSCSNVDLLAFLSLSEVGGGFGVTAADIWGWTDPDTGREYALLGRSNGTAFIEVTDPKNPLYLGSLPLPDIAGDSQWSDIKVYSNHAFVVAEGRGKHGMQVFDLTQLLSVDDVPTTFKATARYDGIHTAHNIVINEDTGFAYAVGSRGGGKRCGGGLHMINIRDPLNPSFAGCFAHEEARRSSTTYSHDAQCVVYDGPDTEHVGKEICLGSNVTVLSIADVTDKENPVGIALADYPNVSYAHQGWLTDDHRYFYLNDEIDELQGKTEGTRTLIWDLTDLDDPQLAGEYISDNRATDHNLYIQGDVMYQSNYKSGLRILDISDRISPTIIGNFDTFPVGADNPGFEGSWSNYPYFKSGTIIVSSIREGLFILKRTSIDI